MSIQPPIPWWRILLTMIACGFAVGLLLGLLQTFLGIHIPGAAVGAAIGAVGGLLIALRWKRRPPPGSP